MPTDVIDEPGTDTVDSVEEVVEPTSAEAEAELAAGFSDEPGALTTEPTGTDSPATIIDPNDAQDSAQAVVPEPEFVYTKAQHQELIDTTAQLKAALGQLEGKAFGKMGELQRTLKALQDGTPHGQPVEISAADFKELSDAFPEVAGMQIAGITRVLSKMKGTGAAVDESRIDSIVNERLKAKELETALETMDLVSEGWRETVNSQEYVAWLDAQPEDYRARLNETVKPTDIKDSLKKFNAAQQAAKPKPKAPAADPAALRRQRIEAAVVAPSSGGGGPHGKSATDQFLEGFNS